MSLKERVVAKPLIPIALVVVIILLIIGICYQLSASTQPAKVTAPPVVAAITPPAPASSVTATEPASTPIATTAVASASAPAPTVAAASSPAASAPLATNRALAEEELDRLNDEHARLKAQKADLAKQLEVSNKIIALKDKQIKALESSAS